MAGTIEQIARIAGVSRGTVDRALNNRGRINTQVADSIKKIAEDIGYVPRSARAGSGQKEKTYKIGVITQLSKSSFMLEVNRGLCQAKVELKEKGVELILRESDSVDEKEQLKAIEELKAQKIDGLAIMPVECESVRSSLNALIEERQIPVVTFNSDIVGTKRSCFIGLDNKKSGYTAAGLMGMLTRGAGKILIITGFFTNSVNNLRVDGFVEEMKHSFPGMELLGVQCSFDDGKEVEKIITNTMSMVPDLAGVFVASGGQSGVRQAFESLQLERRPYVIIYDLTPKNINGLCQNDFDFLIDQEGFVQGYRSAKLLYQMVSRGVQPEGEYIYTDIRVKTKYNL